MPEWAEYNISEFVALNPDHEVMVHDESVLLDEITPYYRQVPEDDYACKADILRICALKKFGGWYFDTDFWAFRSVSDIEHAYQLDGERLFLAKQTGNVNPANWLTNSIIAIKAGHPIIDDLLKRIIDTPAPSGIKLGPQLVMEYADDNPEKVVLGDASWFFPADYHNAVANYARIRAGYKEVALTMNSDTLNQTPFVMHLWAGGKPVLEDKRGDRTIVATLNPDGDKLAGVVLNELQAKLVHVRADHPMRCAAEGLAHLGYRVEVRTEAEWPCFSRKPDVIAVWNGLREPLSDRVQSAVKEGITVFRIEHGWFDRKNYHQCDPKGILHWSSITKLLNQEPPAEYKQRFESVWDRPIRPVAVNKSSDTILVIGQTVGDTQLNESEIVSPLQLDKAVCRAIEGLGVKAEFRPHPLDHQYTHRDRKHYLPTSQYATLEEALENCRYVITINSNAGVEAIANGRPVLCFGPATYAQAGVAWRTTKHNLRIHIECMEMYEADQKAVENYLYWLAGKQYSLEEFKRGIPFRGVA